MAINGLIGAGIFGLPSSAARLAGEYSPLIYVLCALLILPVVLCFAELASYFRSTGGPIRYSTEAFGTLIGFQAGWLYYVSRVGAFAANSALLLDSIGYFWSGAAGGAGRVIALALICGGLTFINAIGSVRAIRSLATLTVVKLAALFLLVIVGAGYLVFLAIQASTARMRDGGRVITIGSNTAIRTGSQGSSVYAMTKAAVATMVKGVALDLAPRRITVNNIQPGPIETDLTAAMVPRLRDLIPLGRVGKAEEVASLVSYLISLNLGKS